MGSVPTLLHRTDEKTGILTNDKGNSELRQTPKRIHRVNGAKKLALYIKDCIYYGYQTFKDRRVVMKIEDQAENFKKMMESYGFEIVGQRTVCNFDANTSKQYPIYVDITVRVK